MSGKTRLLFRRLGELGAQYYNAPYRAAIARAKRDEEDLFMLLVFAEMMGVPNPAAWSTLGGSAAPCAAFWERALLRLTEGDRPAKSWTN